MSEFGTLCTVVVAGFTSHVIYFIHGEYQMRAPWLMLTYFSILIILLIQDWVGGERWFVTKVTTRHVLSFAISLASSIVLYRLRFHRLCKFPGPTLAKVTKLWHVAQLTTMPNFQLLDDLHRRYGKVVRIGKLYDEALSLEVAFLIPLLILQVRKNCQSIRQKP